MTKAIIVSAEPAYYDFFGMKFPQWDIQHPVANIDAMWNDLTNGTLDTESEIVVFTGSEFSMDNQNLEVAVRTLADAALVLILIEPEYQSYFDQKMADLVAVDGVPCGKFWYVNTSSPVPDINTALTEYAAMAQQNVVETAQQTETYHDVVQQAREAAQAVEPAVATPTPTPAVTTPQNASQPLTVDSLLNDNYTGPNRNGFVLASTSSKGGSGKSTVALCTASMFYHSSRLATEAGLRDRPLDVVVVDMDVRDGQIGFFVGSTSPSILNIITGLDYSREAIKRNLVQVPRLGVHTLLAFKRASTADYGTPEVYLEVINKLRTMFDVVILDTSVNYLDPLIKSVVLPVADAVMFVTTLSLGSIFGMTRWIQEVTEPFNKETAPIISKEKIGIVVNQSIAGVNIEKSNLEEAAEDVPIISYIPMDSRAVILATNTRSLDDIVLKHPTISPAYFDIVEALNKGLENSQPLIDPTTVTLTAPAGTPEAKSKLTLPGFGKKKR